MVESSDQKPLVTITGISGYIGGEVTKQFLENGNYRIRGTVRNPTDEAKVGPLREAFGEELFSKIELVAADLLDEASLENAIKGSDYVVHVASPFFFSDDADSLIKPAVDGTNFVMKACQKAAVKRCVITSSLASIQNPAATDKPANRTYNESFWSNPDRPEGLGNYPKSKVLAEKAAWDFQAALPDAEKFEVVTICPAFVMGPPMRKEGFTSGGWMKRLMEGGMDKISSEHCCLVDVRDVARAHVLGVTNAAAANRRFILCVGSPSFQEYAAAVAAKYRPLGWPITENLADANPDEYISLFDNSASKELGVVYTEIDKTMVDMADKMVELGTVKKPTA